MLFDLSRLIVSFSGTPKSIEVDDKSMLWNVAQCPSLAPSSRLHNQLLLNTNKHLIDTLTCEKENDEFNHNHTTIIIINEMGKQLDISTAVPS